MRSIRPLPGAVALAVLVTAAPAEGTHALRGYHWATRSTPFTLRLGDNVSFRWDTHLRTAAADWSASSVLDTTVVAGTTTSSTCRPSSGRVEVCNWAYGRNGWLGVAQIWLSGAHITHGVVKLNDTYFSVAPYSSPEWRQLVVCQEVGHTLGLDHQDEDFFNTPLGTCMDYSRDPRPNQHPNGHDYDQLRLVYGHADSTSTVGSSGAATAAADRPGDWGRVMRASNDGRPSMYERDLGRGRRLVTFVVWAR